jgi:hypothetical protein
MTLNISTYNPTTELTRSLGPAVLNIGRRQCGRRKAQMMNHIINIFEQKSHKKRPTIETLTDSRLTGLYIQGNQVMTFWPYWGSIPYRAR